MDAHEQLSSSLAQQQSRAREWPNCTSTMCIGGSDSHRRSSQIETPASPRPSDVHWPARLEPNKIYQLCSTPRQTDSRSERTNGLNSIYASLQMRSRKIGASGSQWRPQCIMIMSTPPWGQLRARSY